MIEILAEISRTGESNLREEVSYSVGPLTAMSSVMKDSSHRRFIRHRSRACKYESDPSRIASRMRLKCAKSSLNDAGSHRQAQFVREDLSARTETEEKSPMMVCSELEL